MKFFLLLFISILFGTSFSEIKLSENSTIEAATESKVELSDLYQTLNIPELNKAVFNQAISGYYKLWESGKLRNADYITIVDFTKNSNEERLYLIDLKSRKLIDKSLVAHGRNSGHLKANNFSNIPQSYQSSLGFYTTAETYNGKHGFSLRLDGMEPNINDKARERAIVIHGADYVSHRFCQQHGRLGRSFGCPSLPQEKSASIINTIKEKSCLFIYHPDKGYHSASQLVQIDLPANWWSVIFE